MITLDLVRDLPKVVDAYMAGELQMAKEDCGVYCSYKGPCAIGVMVDPEHREYMDETSYPCIGDLLDEGIVTAPVGQSFDLIRLQRLHDDVIGARLTPEAITYPHNIEHAIMEFNRFLLDLKTKYLRS